MKTLILLAMLMPLFAGAQKFEMLWSARTIPKPQPSRFKKVDKDMHQASENDTIKVAHIFVYKEIPNRIAVAMMGYKVYDRWEGKWQYSKDSFSVSYKVDYRNVRYLDNNKHPFDGAGDYKYKESIPVIQMANWYPTLK